MIKAKLVSYVRVGVDASGFPVEATDISNDPEEVADPNENLGIIVKVGFENILIFRDDIFRILRRKDLKLLTYDNKQIKEMMQELIQVSGF